MAHIEQNIDIHVKGKIEAFKDRLEKANMELEDLIKKKDARIQEQDATITRHIILYSRLQENYRSLHHVIDSYKDPQGMAEFREILTRMNKDLNFLIAEKQVQYAKMHAAISLMKDLNFENFNSQVEQEKKIRVLTLKH